MGRPQVELDPETSEPASPCFDGYPAAKRMGNMKRTRPDPPSRVLSDLELDNLPFLQRMEEKIKLALNDVEFLKKIETICMIVLSVGLGYLGYSCCASSN